MSINKIFIDTKNFSDKSKVKIELNDEYIRKYKKSRFYHSRYFISVKQFQMFNQFNNISANKNDRIIIYNLDDSYAIPEDTITLDEGSFLLESSVVGPSSVSEFNFFKQFKLNEGNPSVSDIVNLFNNNDDMKTINLSLSFDIYNNKFIFKNEGIQDRYILFGASYLIFGFSEKQLFRLKFNNTLTSQNSVNVQGDTLILFNLSTDSDISLKNSSYDNINKKHFELNNIFYIQPINVLPGYIIQYTRQCHEHIEINFDHNSLRQFTIEAYNQDKDLIDMSDYFLELEIIEKKENKFLQMILILLRSIIALLV